MSSNSVYFVPLLLLLSIVLLSLLSSSMLFGLLIMQSVIMYNLSEFIPPRLRHILTSCWMRTFWMFYAFFLSHVQVIDQFFNIISSTTDSSVKSFVVVILRKVVTQKAWSQLDDQKKGQSIASSVILPSFILPTPVVPSGERWSRSPQSLWPNFPSEQSGARVAGIVPLRSLCLLPGIRSPRGRPVPPRRAERKQRIRTFEVSPQAKLVAEHITEIVSILSGSLQSSNLAFQVAAARVCPCWSVLTNRRRWRSWPKWRSRTWFPRSSALSPRWSTRCSWCWTRRTKIRCSRCWRTWWIVRGGSSAVRVTPSVICDFARQLVGPIVEMCLAIGRLAVAA